MAVALREAGSYHSDYAALKRRVQEAGLLDKRPGYYATLISANTMALVLVLLLIAITRNPWLLVLEAVAFGAVSGQLGFQLHDAAHRQMFGKGWANSLVGLITGDALLGMSYGWWEAKHNAHHANPNGVDEDPDIGPGAIAYSHEQAMEKTGVMRKLAAYQAYFFFPLLFGLGFAMHGSSVAYLVKDGGRHRKKEMALMALHFTVYAAALVLLLGPWLALLVALVHKAAGGFYMASVFAPNHKGMPQFDAAHRPDFLRSQVLTARNVTASRPKDLFYGSLNYQIEHHLFPTMPRANLRKAHALIKDYCAEIDVPYYEASMLRSYKELIIFLHEVGEPLRQKAKLAA